MDEDMKKEPLEGEVEEEVEEEVVEEEGRGNNKQEEHTEHKAASSAGGDKFMAVLSYIGVLCLIPLLTKKDDAFTFFHAKQGLILFIAEVITAFLSSVPFLGWLIWMVGGVVWFVLSILGIVNVLGGKKKELPIIGQYAEKIKI